jgi:hypothetical protein
VKEFIAEKRDERGFTRMLLDHLPILKNINGTGTASTIPRGATGASRNQPDEIADRRSVVSVAAATGAVS